MTASSFRVLSASSRVCLEVAGWLSLVHHWAGCLLFLIFPFSFNSPRAFSTAFLARPSRTKDFFFRGMRFTHLFIDASLYSFCTYVQGSGRLCIATENTKDSVKALV